MEGNDMKKNYQKPEIQVLLLRHHAHLLNDSCQEGQFTDDEPDVWDEGGGF